MDKSILLVAPLLAILAVMVMSQGQRVSVTGAPLNVTHFFINQPEENITLHVAGWSTGNVLNDEIDLFVGDGQHGALAIGDSIQIAELDGVGMVGNLNVSNTMLIRHYEDDGLNNISLLFTSQNQVRLAIPVNGVDFATYNPRSQMIGGDLGQQNENDIIRCSQQGYDLIDCDTAGTGADLGVQDDLQVRGNSFINLPYGNMWFHNDSANGVLTVISSDDTWTNVSGFNQATDADQALSNVTFVNGNALSPDFNGVYHLTYSMSFEKITGAAVNHEFKTIIFVNGEPLNSTETHRTIMSGSSVGVVSGTTLIVNLNASDVVYLAIQGVGNDEDIGTHAASVNMFRMGN